MCLSPAQVAGERYVYKFVCDPDALFSMAFPDNQRPSLKADPKGLQVPEDDTVPLSHFGETKGVAYPGKARDQCLAGPSFPDNYAYWTVTTPSKLPPSGPEL